MKKKLRNIIGEKYPDDYEPKTEVAQSFVAMHKGAKIDNLGDKGSTEGQFTADNVKEAPHPKGDKSDGFPAEGENDEYNLPTHYDSDGEIDWGFEDDNNIDNDKNRSRQVQDEEVDPPIQSSFREKLEESSVTRKHFREVANTVRSIEDPKKRQEFADHHAGIFAKANPRFSYQKFHDACGTKVAQNEEVEPLDETKTKKEKKKDSREKNIDYNRLRRSGDTGYNEETITESLPVEKPRIKRVLNTFYKKD